MISLVEGLGWIFDRLAFGIDETDTLAVTATIAESDDRFQRTVLGVIDQYQILLAGWLVFFHHQDL
jgi:hypothetical protein